MPDGLAGFDLRFRAWELAVCYNGHRTEQVFFDAIGGADVSGHGPVDDSLVNLPEWSIDEIRALLDDLYEEEQKISYRRRVLHGRIDILRAELVRRLKEEGEAGAHVVSGTDVERLIDILAKDLRGVSRFDVTAADDDIIDE
jgi:hypothetical protein